MPLWLVMVLCILGAGAVYLLICAAAAVYMFHYAIMRKPTHDVSDEKQTKGSVWEPFSAQIRTGRHWISEQKPEHVEIMSDDGLRLRGLWIPAEQAPAKGTILLMHGYHSDGANQFCCMAEFYHDLGYHLLLADQRSHGASEGRYIGYGVLERFDCLRWTEYINQKCGSEMPIILDGLSMGATTVLMAAGLPLPENVKGIIADCGFTSPHDIFTHVLHADARIYLRPMLAAADRICRRKAGYGFRDYSTWEAMAQNRIPVLFIHGLEDHFVPTRMSRENYEACIAPKTLYLVKDARHAVSYLTDRAGYEETVRHFFYTIMK